MATLEKTINLFGVMKWKASKRNEFKSRLASEDYIQCLTAVTELEVAMKMTARFGVDNLGCFLSSAMEVTLT